MVPFMFALAGILLLVVVVWVSAIAETKWQDARSLSTPRYLYVCALWVGMACIISAASAICVSCLMVAWYSL